MTTALDRLFKAVEAVLAALLLGMVLMVFGNVVLRYVFNSGIVVSEELSRIFFVWLTFIGAIVAVRDGTHLGMDNVVERLSRRGKLACLAVSQVLILVCCAILVWGTWRQHEINATTSAAGDRHVDDLDLRPRLRARRVHRPARARHALAHRPRPDHRRTSWCRCARAKRRSGHRRDGRRLHPLPARRDGARHADRLRPAGLRRRPDAGAGPDATRPSCRRSCSRAPTASRCWRFPSSCSPAS